MADDELTDEQWAELQKNHAALQAAHAKDPAATKEALKAAVKDIQNERGIAPKRGKLK